MNVAHEVTRLVERNEFLERDTKRLRRIETAALALVSAGRHPEPIYIGDKLTEETFLALEAALGIVAPTPGARIIHGVDPKLWWQAGITEAAQASYYNVTGVERPEGDLRRQIVGVRDRLYRLLNVGPPSTPEARSSDEIWELLRNADPKRDSVAIVTGIDHGRPGGDRTVEQTWEIGPDGERRLVNQTTRPATHADALKSDGIGERANPCPEECESCRQPKPCSMPAGHSSADAHACSACHRAWKIGRSGNPHAILAAMRRADDVEEPAVVEHDEHLQSARRQQTSWALAQLRHLFAQMMGGHVADTAGAARGLLGPAISALEQVAGTSGDVVGPSSPVTPPSCPAVEPTTPVSPMTGKPMKFCHHDARIDLAFCPACDDGDPATHDLAGRVLGGDCTCSVTTMGAEQDRDCPIHGDPGQPVVEISMALADGTRRRAVLEEVTEHQLIDAVDRMDEGPVSWSVEPPAQPAGGISAAAIEAVMHQLCFDGDSCSKPGCPEHDAPPPPATVPLADLVAALGMEDRTDAAKALEVARLLRSFWDDPMGSATATERAVLERVAKALDLKEPWSEDMIWQYLGLARQQKRDFPELLKDGQDRRERAILERVAGVVETWRRELPNRSSLVESLAAAFQDTWPTGESPAKPAEKPDPGPLVVELSMVHADGTRRRSVLEDTHEGEIIDAVDRAAGEPVPWSVEPPAPPKSPAPVDQPVERQGYDDLARAAYEAAGFEKWHKVNEKGRAPWRASVAVIERAVLERVAHAIWGAGPRRPVVQVALFDACQRLAAAFSGTWPNTESE